MDSRVPLDRYYLYIRCLTLHAHHGKQKLICLFRFADITEYTRVVTRLVKRTYLSELGGLLGHAVHGITGVKCLLV